MKKRKRRKNICICGKKMYLTCEGCPVCGGEEYYQCPNIECFRMFDLNGEEI